ncbi:unnamed protein product [Blepharisma stoltei]|uniref:Uncharacterized protein n=1 Tax=Blepharisma stoltei TaxID=1481888 RepID=A0AAU9J1H5_9CILI|nr:unnamed protein product [Blepharisma stoltei]
MKRHSSLSDFEDETFYLNKTVELPKISMSSSSSLSTLTVKQNEHYEKPFKLIEVFTNRKYSIKSKMPKLKESLPLNFYGKQFDDLIQKLNIVCNEKKFSSQFIDVEEGESPEGFIAANEYQFFSVKVKDLPSPLRVKIEREKGRLEIFASFKNVKPTADVYEYHSVTDLLEIIGRHSNFVERKCFIGVKAIIDARFKVEIKFGNENKPGVKHQGTTKQIYKKVFMPSYMKEIQRIKANPELRAEFEFRVQSILEKRRNEQRQNYVEFNRSLANITPMNQSDILGKIKEREKHRLEVHKRKSQQDEDKDMMKKSVLLRKEMRIIAEKKAQQIQNIISRKEFFEKTWFTLIYSAHGLVTWQSLYEDLKKKIQRYKLLHIKANKIQRCFRSKFPSGFDIKTRQVALAKNQLRLMFLLGGPLVMKISKRNIASCIKEIATKELVPSHFVYYIQCVLKIKAAWKKSLESYNSKYKQLIEKWNDVLEEMISQLAGSKVKKKKRKQASGKLLNIPESLRNKVLNEHMKEAIQELWGRIRKKQKVVYLKYWIEKEEMKKLILSASRMKKKYSKGS